MGGQPGLHKFPVSLGCMVLPCKKTATSARAGRWLDGYSTRHTSVIPETVMETAWACLSSSGLFY